MGINDIKNEAAESAVVATVIKWPSVTVFSEQLKPHMFTDKFAGAVYLCVVKLFESGVNKITEMNLELELRRNKNTKAILISCNVIVHVQSMLDILQQIRLNRWVMTRQAMAIIITR